MLNLFRQPPQPDTLIHCSYHKCLTLYVTRVFKKLYGDQPTADGSGGYRHFTSQIEQFYAHRHQYRVASVNNHALDFSQFPGEMRITRFIRDPRDLVVSGYFYHKKGAEPWSRETDPDPVDYRHLVNGCLPEQLAPGESYRDCLERLDIEAGLIAEIDFRRYHFESMRNWNLEDPRIKLFRYEEIIGREQQTFKQMLHFYRAPRALRSRGLVLARRFSAKRQTNPIRHIRNPSPGQWRSHFTPKVTDYFNDRYRDILALYDYPL
ncbi:MAG: sulfotransferase domain-containing protein [Cyanobacteria bacterium P01_H01_bin.15]